MLKTAFNGGESLQKVGGFPLLSFFSPLPLFHFLWKLLYSGKFLLGENFRVFHGMLVNAKKETAKIFMKEL